MPSLDLTALGEGGVGRKLVVTVVLLVLVIGLRALVTAIVERAKPAYDHMRERYFLAERAELPARVYLRMTDNWLELSLRFLAPVHGVRALKDAMTREILRAFEKAGLSIASTTFAITELPVVRVEGMRG